MSELSQSVVLGAIAAALAVGGCSKEVTTSTPPPPPVSIAEVQFIGAAINNEYEPLDGASVEIRVLAHGCRVDSGTPINNVTTDSNGSFKFRWSSPLNVVEACFSVSSTVEGVGSDTALVYAWPRLGGRIDTVGVYLRLR